MSRQGLTDNRPACPSDCPPERIIRAGRQPGGNDEVASPNSFPNVVSGTNLSWPGKKEYNPSRVANNGLSLTSST